MVAARAVTSANQAKTDTFYRYLATPGPQKTVLNVPKGKFIFRHGDPADSVSYIQKGQVKISVTSAQGREATLALHRNGDFIGEECILASHPQRLASATAIQPCTILKIERGEMIRALEEDQSLARFFQAFLLTRCAGMKGDLIDHLLNSSEKRLARTLILLASLDGGTEATIPHTTQETLAEMVGTTRSRVSFFMNRFRKLGYIQYKGSNCGVQVHRSLFNILLKE